MAMSLTMLMARWMMLNTDQYVSHCVSSCAGKVGVLALTGKSKYPDFDRVVWRIVATVDVKYPRAFKKTWMSRVV